MITVEKKKFKRTKPNLNVSTMGHVDHGKTTLTSAITYVQSLSDKAEFLDYEAIDRTPEEKKRKITISVFITEYETEKYHVIHSDAPGHEDFVKNATVGFSQADNGLLVVSGIEGAKPQTKEHLNLANHLGIKKIIVVISKLDLINDINDRNLQFELTQSEIMDLAIRYGFKEKDIKFIEVSSVLALKNDKAGIQQIKNLINIIDEHFIIPEADLNKPFLMSIESTYNIKGRGTVVAGRVTYGSIKTNQKLMLSGLMSKSVEVKVLDLEMFRKSLDYVQAGDNPGVLIASTEKFQKNKFPIRGQTLILPNSYKTHYDFQAQVYITSEKEGGRNKGFKVGYKPQFFIKTADITGEIYAMFTPDSDETSVNFVKPGDIIKMSIKLVNNVILNLKDNFIIREGKKTIGSGKVIKIFK